MLWSSDLFPRECKKFFFNISLYFLDASPTELPFMREFTNNSDGSRKSLG